MIIGSGLLAKACYDLVPHSDRICIYAAGVSNSACSDVDEFERERDRLVEALSNNQSTDFFVYFSTCSIADRSLEESPYVRHKRAMEELVATHPNFLIARLPQVAGRSPNPHTLLNYLYARIARSERFLVFENAFRNIIDVEDAMKILAILIQKKVFRGQIVHIANPVSSGILEIVHAMEKVIGKRAIIKVVKGGSSYHIDISAIQPLVDQLGIPFGANYLKCVLQKYYGAWQ